MRLPNPVRGVREPLLSKETTALKYTRKQHRGHSTSGAGCGKKHHSPWPESRDPTRRSGKSTPERYGLG